MTRNTSKSRCFFHNLSGYDGHILSLAVAKFPTLKVDVIAKSAEKYMMLKLGNIEIKDSLQFLSASLQSLAENLRSDPNHTFPFLSEEYPDVDHRALLMRKNPFPYSYMNDMTKLDEPSLPPIEAFKNDLTGEELSVEDYTHAQQVWNTFGMRTFKDYMELYERVDVLLLTEVFQAFRNLSMRVYQLDPCHFLSTPALSFNAMLKSTGVNIELLKDVNMYQMGEDFKRGGISMITTKYAKANDRTREDFDPSKPESAIYYVDANNL